MNEFFEEAADAALMKLDELEPHMNTANFIKEFDQDFVARYGVDHPDVTEQGLYWSEDREEFVYRVTMTTNKGATDFDLAGFGIYYSGYNTFIGDFVGHVAELLGILSVTVRTRCNRAHVFERG